MPSSRFQEPQLVSLPWDGPAPRCVSVVPGTGDLLVGSSRPGRIVRLAADGTQRDVEVPLEDRWGAPLRWGHLVGLPGNRALAIALDDACTFSLGTPRELRRLPLGGGYGTAGSNRVAADANGAVLVAVAGDRLVRFGGEGEPDCRVLDAGVGFSGVAVSRDGGHVANGREDGRVELRRPADLEVVRTLEGLRAPALCLSFSPDGRRLVGSDDTGRTVAWECADGAATPVQGLGKVVAVQWLGDGSTAVVVGLTRQLGAFDCRAPEACWTWSPEGFGTSYFLDAVLLDDRRLVVVVEDRGLLEVRFR